MIGERPISRAKAPILKVRGGSTVELVIRSSDPFGFHVHWIRDRSFMCPGTQCLACNQAIGTRWLGMLPIRWALGPVHEVRSGLLEVTAGAFERLEGLARMEGVSSLFGLEVVASRRTDKSPMRVEPLVDPERRIDPGNEVSLTTVADLVATIWGLPSCPDGLSLHDWEASAIDAARRLVAVAVRRELSDTASA